MYDQPAGGVTPEVEGAAADEEAVVVVEVLVEMDVVEVVTGLEDVEEGVAAMDVVDVVGAAGEDDEEELTTFWLAPEAGAV